MDERFGHQIALVIEEAAAAVKFDSAIAVVDLEVEELGAVLARSGFGQVEELSADALAAMRGFDEELVDPGAFAAIFEAEVETDGKIRDGGLFVTRKIDEAVGGSLEKVGKIFSNDEFVEGFGPRIFELHVAHQEPDGF